MWSINDIPLFVRCALVVAIFGTLHLRLTDTFSLKPIQLHTSFSAASLMLCRSISACFLCASKPCVTASLFSCASSHSCCLLAIAYKQVTSTPSEIVTGAPCMVALHWTQDQGMTKL